MKESFVLVLSQRDVRHPGAGGAEVYMHNALRGLAREVAVVHLSQTHPDLPGKDVLDGVMYIRAGRNLASVIWQGFKFYIRYRRQVLLVIDHSNTHQFFTFLWVPKTRRVFFTHQLTQEIWLYFFGPLAGRAMWAIEEILLKLSRGTTVTVSESTKADLLRRGFGEVRVCPEGNVIRNNKLPDVPKEDYLVYTGRLVPYKRVEDAVWLAAKTGRKLYVVGRGLPDYADRLARFAGEVGADCEFAGFLSEDEKASLISRAYMLVLPSIREGWGLVVTESANLGTPSLVYSAPGVVEAVDHGRAGFVAPEFSRKALLETFRKIAPETYEEVRRRAFEYSLRFSWDLTGNEFCKIVKGLLEQREGVY